jgi:hypothetical protein
MPIVEPYRRTMIYSPSAPPESKVPPSRLQQLTRVRSGSRIRDGCGVAPEGEGVGSPTSEDTSASRARIGSLREMVADLRALRGASVTTPGRAIPVGPSGPVVKFWIIHDDHLGTRREAGGDRPWNSIRLNSSGSCPPRPKLRFSRHTIVSPVCSILTGGGTPAPRCNSKLFDGPRHSSWPFNPLWVRAPRSYQYGNPLLVEHSESWCGVVWRSVP